MDTISPFWLAFNLRNDADSKHLDEYFMRSTIKHLTGKALVRYVFSVPSIAEQKEIVRRVESLFALAEQIEVRYAKAQAHMDKLTPSLLAKAFRGGLVRTEAELAEEEGREYETATTLLEQIRSETGPRNKARKVR